MYKLPIFIDATDATKIFKNRQPYMKNFSTHLDNRDGIKRMTSDDAQQHFKHVLFHEYNCTYDYQSFNRDINNLQFNSEADAVFFLLRFS